MNATFLDELPFVDAVTAWGAVGLHGDLGYDGGRVRVRNTPYLHAISAHAPSRVRVRLDGGYTTFRCHVALNDDVRSGASCADFRVISDGRLVAAAQRVVAGGLPIELTADVNDVAVLELRSETDRPTYCHSVWIDPFLSTESTRVSDPLDRVEFDNSRARIRAPRCVATVVTPNFVNLLDEMLASLRMSNPSTDIAVVVLAVDPDRACYEVAERHGAITLPCTARRRPDPSIKSALYSVARLVDAEGFLCLDADTLVLGDIAPLFAALEACSRGTILASADQNRYTFDDLGRALTDLYQATESDIGRFVGAALGEARFPLVLNDGAFAGARFALLSLDSAIRSMPGAPQWVDTLWLRNQFLFNLALARMRCAVQMDDVFNLQLHAQDVELLRANGHISASWRERPVRILHFNATGRDKLRELRNSFASPDHIA